MINRKKTPGVKQISVLLDTETHAKLVRIAKAQLNGNKSLLAKMLISKGLSKVKGEEELPMVITPSSKAPKIKNFKDVRFMLFEGDSDIACLTERKLIPVKATEEQIEKASQIWAAHKSAHRDRSGKKEYSVQISYSDADIFEVIASIDDYKLDPNPVRAPNKGSHPNGWRKKGKTNEDYVRPEEQNPSDSLKSPQGTDRG